MPATRPASIGLRPGARLDRYLLRLLIRPALVSLGLAVTVLLLEKALRLIGALSAGGGRLAFVAPLMADLAPYYLAIATPVGFFAALFIVFSALDEGGEIEAMLSAGISLDRIAAPFVATGMAVGVGALLVSGWLEPLGRYAFSAGQADATRAGWAGKMDGGAVFAPRADVSLEADKVGLGGHALHRVFLTRREPSGGETVVTARAATLGLVHGGRDVDLLLRDGVILRDAADARAPLERFDILEQIEPSGGAGTRPVRGGDERELTLPELVGGLGEGTPTRRRVLAAELAVKLARAAVVPFLPFLALPLALSAKRGGRAIGVIVAGVVLAAFHHTLQLCKGLAVNGRLESVWPIVIATAAFAFLCLNVHVASRKRPGDNPVTRLASLVPPLVAFLRRLLTLPQDFTLRLRLPGRVGLAGYVMRLLAVRTAVVLLGLLVFLQVVDLQEMAPKILARGLGAGGLLHFEMLRAPAMIVQIAGISLLIGAVLTFTALARRGESVAMQASGVSPYRIVCSALPVALAVAALNLVAASEIAPRAQAAMNAWWSRTTPMQDRAAPAPYWFRVGTDIVRADEIAPDGRRMEGVRVYRRGAAGLLLEQTVASVAQWRSGWELQQLVVHRAGAETVAVGRATQALWRGPQPTPADLRAIRKGPEELPSSTAAWTLFSGAPTDERTAFLATRAHRILAEPLAPLVMLLLASPVLLGGGARRSSAPQMAFALGCGLLYLVVDGLFTALGEAGDLAPLIAAWTAPVLFAAAGATALLFAEG